MICVRRGETHNTKRTMLYVMLTTYKHTHTYTYTLTQTIISLLQLVLERPDEVGRRASNNARAIQAREDARKKAQAKKDALLEELEADEKKLKKGFFGLW